MSPVHSARAAKEFLVSKIIEEAQRENVVLSETERKMLYFSETGWTLPDMAAISEEFDATYDWRDYEKKIARLIRNAGKRVRKKSSADYDVWWETVRRLNSEDHYVSVMVRQSGLRPRGDLFRLWTTGVGIVTAFILVTFLSIKFGIDLDKYLPSRGGLALYIWGSACIAVILYQFFRLFLGSKRVDDWLSGVLEKLVRLRAR